MRCAWCSSHWSTAIRFPIPPRLPRRVGRHGIIYTSLFFFSSRRRHTRSTRDWSSDVCSSDLDGRRGRVQARDGSARTGPSRVRRLIAVVVVLGLLGFLVSRGIDWWNFNVNTPISSSGQNVSFHIDPGETPTQIGTDLYDLHLIRSTIAWDVYTRATNAGPKFQAGSFVLSSNMSLSQIVSALQHGRPDEKTITFPEGFPLR